MESRYAPEKGRPPMPLDEGLFRFITDILIPVMDIYDDDPIRKDAVQHENLVVIQENRRSIRSIYYFLAQPWPHYQERVLAPATLRYVLEYAHGKLEEAEEAVPPPPPEEGDAGPKAVAVDMGAIFGGEERLNLQQLEVILETLDSHVSKIMANHPEEPDQRALLFWEFFEVLMESCRSLAVADTPLEKAIPAYVQTMLAFMGLVDREEAELPSPAMEMPSPRPAIPLRGGKNVILVALQQDLLLILHGPNVIDHDVAPFLSLCLVALTPFRAHALQATVTYKGEPGIQEGGDAPADAFTNFSGKVLTVEAQRRTTGTGFLEFPELSQLISDFKHDFPTILKGANVSDVYSPFAKVRTRMVPVQPHNTFATAVDIEIATPEIIVSVYLLLFVPLAMSWAYFVHYGYKESHYLIMVPFTLCSFTVGLDLVNQSLSTLTAAPMALTAIQAGSTFVAMMLWTFGCQVYFLLFGKGKTESSVAWLHLQ
ncbi:unnamed protein product [Effrenium voratum]|uniref:Uncharacterized protein n=1 Tax=Effrenium voratum TaxID=2562239 RepID=A0AA36IBH9_9DINO|nr:unnamed protein product [Effrenium voratum]